MAKFRETDVPDGSLEQPVLIEEDHDAPQSGIGFEVETLVRQVQKGDARFNPIDLDREDENLSEDPWRADEESYDNDNAKVEREELPNEREDTQDGPCVHWKKGVRNPCPCGNHRQVPKLMVGNVELSHSQVVELKESVRVGRYEADFIEVYEIWIPYKSGNPFIRGRTYARTRNLEGRLVPWQNEVCEIYELDENDHRATNPATYLDQALVEVPIKNIKTVRTLHKTNKEFPECRFDRSRYRTKEQRENEAPLTCRWRMVLSYPDPRYRRQQRPISGEEIRQYDQNDVPKGRHRILDSERRKHHQKIRGGSYIPNGAPDAESENFPVRVAKDQKYSAADFFSGAGGYSMGAKIAGLKVLLAVDHWPRCCETYRQNFPDVELHQEDIYKFIEDTSTDLTREHLNIDILHFSPPCQTWSPAHTCQGKKDEENRATLFACEKITAMFKPRIFTVEQTFGLAQDRWIPNFNALLQGFTRHGYSVKWKVLHLVEYGLPQTRKRLVMIGAAPGEQLPEWPKPTHSKEPKDGQKPFMSAFKACSILVEGESLHDVEGARQASKPPWDSSKPLGRTVTCSGGQCHHWSGERDLTLAEFSVIQGFPVGFRFVGKCIKKQIGNAFAPIVVKVLLKCIRVHLEKFDGVTCEPPPSQVIILSDDDNDSHDNNGPKPQHKDQVQSRIKSNLVVEDLVGFHVKPSVPSPELLEGMVEYVRENPVPCLLAKSDRKSSKDDSSAFQDPQRSSQRGMTQAQPPQRNNLYSYFLQLDNQNTPSTSNPVAQGNSSEGPDNTADSDLATVDDEDRPAQEVVAVDSSPSLRIPSTSDGNVASEASSARQDTDAVRIINAGIINATPHRSPSDSDKARTRRSAQTAVTVADFDSLARTTRSSPRVSITTGRNSGQTIVYGRLSAPSHLSNSDTNTTMPRRSARKACTIADLNESPRQTRSASSGAAQPPRVGRVVGGVLQPPERRQSPPGFHDTPPLYQAPPTTRSVPESSVAAPTPVTRATPTAPESSGAAPSPVARAVQSRSNLNNAVRARTIAEKEAIRGVIEAARQSTIFPGLAEKLEKLHFGDQDVANPSSPGARIDEGVTIRSRKSSSGASVEYLGESSRAGARPSLPLVVEDEEEEDEDEEDKQLQSVIKGSMKDTPVDDQGFSQGDIARAFQVSVLENHPPIQKSEPDDLYGCSDDDAAAPGPELEMYGPGDYKGKGKAVVTRKFDEYADDEEEEEEEEEEEDKAQGQDGPSKRPRGHK